ncbi:MAG: 50S ribosomal protein L30 [Deltaproteobacteria bacterium]|nr:50S ribosomal protein L30 [Deltaproteobacteria bacterium]
MAIKAKLRVTQVRGFAGKKPEQVLVLKGLGLRGPHSEVLVDNTPSFRGMVKKVLHLVKVEECDG